LWIIVILLFLSVIASITFPEQKEI
jgi:hypothetical protein